MHVCTVCRCSAPFVLFCSTRLISARKIPTAMMGWDNNALNGGDTDNDIDCGIQQLSQGTGTTALHMANAYDYYWVGKMLVAGGANPELKNDEGNTAASGIEGDKPETGDFIAAMTNAINEDELNTAFTNLEVEAKDQKIDKGKFVFEGMKKKKECKNPEEAAHGLWTTEANAKFTSIVQSL